ncbi:MAG: MATE family efflux transporter [Betaproteobacteria bacterium]|nr:MAG: MATE family efflux transporter [Betaproteobacteria bacterium]
MCILTLVTNLHYSRLTTDPIPKLLLTLAIPSSIGFFFNTMYNVVDMLVAGYLSTQALASLSISFPIFFTLIAIGMGVGTGATTLIANALGKNDEAAAKRYAKQTISFGVLLGITISILGTLVTPSFLTLLGAEGAYLATASNYLFTIFCGSIFITMTFMFNAILNAVGDTKSYRNVLIASFFINSLLSPTLAFGWFGLPTLSILGIALATIVSNALSALYLWHKVRGTRLIKQESWGKYVPDVKSYLDIAGQGFPVSLSMMTISIGAFIIMYFVSSFGEITVAGYGVALRVEQMVLIPGIGITVAVLTLISQNNGAEKYDRVREIIRVAIRYSLYLSTLAAVFILFFSKYVMGIFTDDQAVINSGVGYLSVAAFITWAYGLLFVTNSVFRGLKRPLFPLLIGILRQVILPFPLLWFAITVLNFDILEVWWIIFAIVWIAAIIAMIYVRNVVNKVCVGC